jgi:hypothetical protein
LENFGEMENLTNSPICKKGPHLGNWVAIHNKKIQENRLDPLELYLGSLEQDQGKLDKNHPLRS